MDSWLHLNQTLDVTLSPNIKGEVSLARVSEISIRHAIHKCFQADRILVFSVLYFDANFYKTK